VARQNIDELIALKKRSGRRGGRFPSGFDIMRLRDAWASSTDPKELFASLLPARVVTLIEVFCRYWVQKLIDQGAPYDERAIDLKINIKYDLPLIRSLHGQTISLGFLISNNVPLRFFQPYCTLIFFAGYRTHAAGNYWNMSRMAVVRLSRT
jgi:hypothetical protein